MLSTSAAPQAQRSQCQLSGQWLRSLLTAERIPYHFGTVALSRVDERPYDQFRVGDERQIDLSVRQLLPFSAGAPLTGACAATLLQMTTTSVAHTSPAPPNATPR